MIEVDLFGEQVRAEWLRPSLCYRLLTFELSVIGCAKAAGFPAAKLVLNHMTPTSPPPIEAGAFAYTSNR